jgi:hypothetical protein
MTVIFEEKKFEEHCTKVSDHTGKRPTSMTHVPNAIRRSYDAKCKVTVNNYAEKMNNCNAAGKQTYEGGAVECKLHLKIFQWPQAWMFPRIRKGNC